MAKDDTLGVEMGKLEIEPQNNKDSKDCNPFHLQQRNLFITKPLTQNLQCTCSIRKKSKCYSTHKKKINRLIREPTLKLIRKTGDIENIFQITLRKTVPPSVHRQVNSDSISLCTLVDNCNQLKISSESSQLNSTQELRNKKTVQKTMTQCRQSQGTSEKSIAGTCSQQVLNPPCDITIDELASYFETLVHIPKKMSSMAEMMYI